jgi:hypothetical protein
VATLGFVALVLTSAFLLGRPEGTTASSGSTSSKPSPANVIVGKAIRLPASLYLASDANPLITPSQARIVATTMWGLWERALVAKDTRALTQLIAPGPFLGGTLQQCVFPAGNCVFEKTPRTFTTLVPVVPVEHTYPLYFLAEFATTESVQDANGLSEVRPWVELQVLTKSSSTEPWRLSFDTGYDGIGANQPPLLPFEQNGDLYNPAPSAAPIFPASAFLQILAMYWQSYKDTGQPPQVNNFFVNDGGTSGQGQQFAQVRQNSIYAGSVEHFTLSADPGAGEWRFTVSGGYPMECGSVLDTATNTGIKNELLGQNQDETNFGWPLPPGSYRRITTKTVHETCIFADQNYLDAAGSETDTFAVTGEPG